MKKQASIFFLVLFVLSIKTETYFAQDSVMPFNYVGEGKWFTRTEYVRQYDKDLAKLEFYDSAYAELEKQIKLYGSVIDSLKDEIEMYKKIIEAKNNIIANKQNYISGLEKPREIGANNKASGKPLFSYEGIYFILGAAYRFEKLNVTGENIISGIKYFGSLEAGWLLFDKVKFNFEVTIPAEIKLKGGIRL